jgi:hypothetical protein
VGKVIADDDELPEFTDSLDEDGGAIGLDDPDDLATDIDEGPEDVGLDVDTLGGAEDDDLLLDEEEEESGELDADGSLELEGIDDDDDDDEHGWTEGSEGSGEGFDDDLPDDDEDGELDDDGGLEGLEEPELEGSSDDEETSVSIGDDDDEESDEELGRLEIDIG